ncbi:MAG: hypothetical protein FJ144_17480 [Deltaproteobacteria bacterium]|nr:hypothetical protein [Deltaproteobacteria bacterium]
MVSLSMWVAACGGGDDDGDNCNDTVQASTATICSNIAAGLGCSSSSFSGTTCSLSDCICDQCGGQLMATTQAVCEGEAVANDCGEFIFDDGVDICTFYDCACVIIDDDDDVVDDVFDDDDF